MALLNNFLQEPAFECIFHPAWGKQFVPVSSSASYQGDMQFIFVSKFSELCRTKETFTCIVPPVIWSNGQCCYLFSSVPWGWRVEVFIKDWDQKSFLKMCLSSLCLSLWFNCECLHFSASCWPKGAWLLLWWGAFCKCNVTPFPLRLPCIPNCLFALKFLANNFVCQTMKFQSPAAEEKGLFLSVVSSESNLSLFFEELTVSGGMCLH